MKKGGIPNEPLYPKPVAVHSRMADSKTLQEHQEALLNLRSRSLRLAYTLQNFTDIRKAQARVTDPGKRGGGKTFAGLKHLEGIDLEWLAINLSQNDYGGKKATSQAFKMADQVFILLKKVNVEYSDKWDLGRVLLSAFTLAGIYHLKKIDDRGDAPYYVIDALGSMPEETTPERTRHEPFPKWTKNWDEFGNRLVKPSYPCPPDLEYSPNFKADSVWLRAVHKLENTAFRINTEVLEWANNPKVQNKLVPKLPKGYKKEKDALEKDRPKIKRLEKKKEKGELTEKGREFWGKWWQAYYILDAKKTRFESKRYQFERHLTQANVLAKDGRSFYQRVSLDYRGRVYLPDFSYQGSDFCRAVIEFTDAGVMTNPAVASLARHTTNVIGKNLPTEEKMWGGRDESNELSVYAMYPFSDKTIKKCLEADKPFCLFRTALEWRNFYVWVMMKNKRKIPLKDLSDYEEMYDALELVTIKTKKYKGHELVDVKNKNHLVSHLPIAADHRNSAFQHIGMMLNDDRGKALVERCRTEDLYEFIASKSGLPPKDARKLVKMVMVPWSYGGTEISCRKNILEYRLENVGKIEYLDNLDCQGVYDLVRTVFNLLNTEFPACQTYQKRVTDNVKKIKNSRPTNSNEGIWWMSPSEFWVMQQVFSDDNVFGYVWDGESRDVQLKAKMPSDQIAWRKMATKAPPNLVHSVDAAVVHILLSGLLSEWDIEFGSIIPIHDSFSVMCDEAHAAMQKFQWATETVYVYPPLDDFISDSTGTPRKKLPPKFQPPKKSTYS